MSKTPGGRPVVPTSVGTEAPVEVPVKLNLIPWIGSPKHICWALSDPGKLESDES